MANTPVTLPMHNKLVSILTPTYKRPVPILQRCIRSVLSQTHISWEHLICSDEGEPEWHIKSLLTDERQHYMCLDKHYNDFGNTSRQRMLNEAKGEYIVYLDDDNILFPKYLGKMVEALEKDQEAQFVICELLHFGPLPVHLGTPPVIMIGFPFVRNIDTLQVMARVTALRKVGWASAGYFADGVTYEELGKQFNYTRVSECLAAHL